MCRLTQPELAPAQPLAPLSDDEVARFAGRRRTGRRISYARSVMSLVEGVRASAGTVRARLLTALSKVEIFSLLEAKQLDAMCDAMAEAPYEQGQYVFEQDDEGDAFYVIIEGEAAAVRVEPGARFEQQLATLGAGAFFGERALLKSQMRYAGVRALTRLFTVSITRAAFEAAIGQPLEKCVPDKYRLDQAELHSRLRAVALFEKLSKKQIELVADRCTEVRLPCGEDVVRQGETGDAFYVITRGTAQVPRWSEDGHLVLRTPSDAL